MIQNIVFYYPSKIIGGAELLFVRNAIKLSEISQYSIYYVDYDDGYSVDAIANSTVSHITYMAKKTVIPSNSLVITQLDKISRYDSLFRKVDNCRFLFWGIHVDNLRYQIYRKGKCLIRESKKKELGIAISSLMDSNIVRFMDYPNYKINADEFSFSKENVSYLPVPIDDKTYFEESRKDLLKSDEIHFAWVGRLSSDKYKTLLTVMNEIAAFKCDKKKILHIVGTGAYLEIIKEFSKSLPFEIIFEGSMCSQDLGDFIVNNTDIGIAMGTSNLEFGRCGVPAILKGYVEDVREAGYTKDYIRTDEILGYSLGASEDFNLKNPNIGSFSAKINAILDNYAVVALSCLEYTKKNHSLDVTARMIISCTEDIEPADIKFINSSLKLVKKSMNSSIIGRIIKLKRTICRK